MKKLKRILIFLAVLVLAFPFLPARAEKNTGVVRVLLTRLNLADRLEITLDGSYTLNGLSFQRGSRLTAQLADGTIFVYYEGMAFDAACEAIRAYRKTTQLAFTLAKSRADPTAHAVRCEMGPHATQARVQVLILRQTHLQTSFARQCVQ